jgi:hypothetical protein
MEALEALLTRMDFITPRKRTLKKRTKREEIVSELCKDFVEMQMIMSRMNQNLCKLV